MFCAPFSALRVGLEPELALYWPSHHPASQPTESPDLATLTGIRDTATKADVENHFNTHGTGEITEIKLMNGFGFIEYKDAMDARDVVPGKCLLVSHHHNAGLANPPSSFPYVQPTHPLHPPQCLTRRWVPSLPSLVVLVMLSTADIFRWLDGSEFMGERLVVQFARGSTRPREGFEHQPRMAPRPRRTVHRMTITGLPFETSWQVSNNQSPDS